MSGYVITDTELTAIADAIRSKTQRTGLLSPSEMVTEIESIGTGSAGLDDMIARSTEEIVSRTATEVGSYAFYNYSTLRTAFLPAVAMVGQAAFSGCTMLDNVVLGSLTGGLGASAFQNCSSLRSLDLRYSSLSYLPANVFAGSGLAELWLPEGKMCTLANVNCFQNSPLAYGGTGGTLYVPAAYRVRYEANANWAYIFSSPANRVISY